MTKLVMTDSNVQTIVYVESGTCYDLMSVTMFLST